uniref:Arrestin_N domain-containing protein n=1 Tax=Ascaris lumbricoides TaxID=6252 RepID=A0A0M3IF87_ASCLU
MGMLPLILLEEGFAERPELLLRKKRDSKIIDDAEFLKRRERVKASSVPPLEDPGSKAVWKPFTVVVEFNFVHSVSVASLIGYFEGIVRTAFSSQSELRSLSAIRLDFDSLVRQWRSATGKLRALAGHYIHESRIALDSDTPGTFFAKNGERIVVHGEILNEHPSNPVKGGLVELVITIRCRCKGNEKNS